MYCTVCGKQINDNSNVCPYCYSKQIPLMEIQVSPTKYDQQNYNQALKIGEKIGKIIGKSLNIGITVGTEIGRGIKEGIQNEMNNKN